MNLNESIAAIRSLLEYRVVGETDRDFRNEEMIIGDRTFIVTGSISATVIDDSDYNRETGYGRMVYPTDFEHDIKSITEVMDDGSEVDVTNDPEVVSMVEEAMEGYLSD